MWWNEMRKEEWRGLNEEERRGRMKGGREEWRI